MKILIGLKSLGYWFLQRMLFFHRPGTSASASHTGIIYKPDAIGDFILASGVIRSLLSISHKKWILICSPQVKNFAEHYFPELEIRVLEGSNSKQSFNGLKKIISLRTLCKSINVEELICLKNGLTGMDHVILSWLNPQRSFGFPESPILPPCPASYKKFTFTNPLLYPVKRSEFPLEVCAHAALLEEYNDRSCSFEQVKPFLKMPRVKTESKILLIFPTTRSYLRNYPLDKLSVAIKNFAQSHKDFHIILSGTASERKTIESFQSFLSPDVVSEIILPESVILAAELIQKAALILSMDSAPAHISICLDRPGVFLLAGGHFDHFAPWGDSKRHIWLHQRMDCYHCNWNCLFKYPKCIWDIPPDRISRHLSDLADHQMILDT